MQQPVGPVRELLGYRELLWMLAWRDVRVRYKHTLLGAAWAVAPPVLTMLVFVFAFGHVMGLSNDTLTGGTSLPYPLFALAGLAPWTFFTAGLTGALQSLVGNRNLLTKIYFPREVFPLASVGSASADFLVALGVMAAIVAGFHWFTPWTYQFSPALLLLPVIILTQAALMIGIGFFLSMGNLFYRDVGFVFRGLIPLLMFVTNVVYPLQSSHPVIDRLIHLNPMVAILTAYRAALSPEIAFPIAGFLTSAVIALVTLLLGWMLFHRSAYTFAERV